MCFQSPAVYKSFVGWKWWVIFGDHSINIFDKQAGPCAFLSWLQFGSQCCTCVVCAPNVRVDGVGRPCSPSCWGFLLLGATSKCSRFFSVFEQLFQNKVSRTLYYGPFCRRYGRWMYIKCCAYRGYPKRKTTWWWIKGILLYLHL